MEIEGTCASKNLDETVRLQSEKRQEWIREIRGERLQGIAEGASSALCMASSSAASFLRRNECPGTHCSLIKGKTKERTEWRGQNESQIEGKEKWQACWCCRDQQRACRMAQASAEKLEHIGPAEKERVASVPQRKQLASTPKPPLPRGEGTKPSVQRTRS